LNCGADFRPPRTGGRLPGADRPLSQRDELYFRVVAWEWSDFLDKGRNRPEYLNEQERAAPLAKAPVLAWSTNLAPTPTSRNASSNCPPDSLKPGFYFLIPAASRISPAATIRSPTPISGKRSALIVRSRNGDIEGFVLEANSGEAVRGAK
jgi:hypothetical protein